MGVFFMKDMLKIIVLPAAAILLFTHTAYAQEIDELNGELVKLNGTDIFVNVVGDGEPVIVIHGGPVLDHSYLLKHFDTLTNDYRLIFFDQRLSGRSSAKVDTSSVKMKMFIEDIEALRQHLGLEQAHILGHSWGGLLAMEYAIAYPAHTKSLIMANSMPPSAELWKQEQHILAQESTKHDSLRRQEIMQSELLKKNPPEAIEKLLMLSFKKQFHDTTLVDNLELYVPEDYMARSQLFGLLKSYLSAYNLNEQLHQLTMPALVIYGSDEPAAKLSGPVLDKQIPSSTLSIIEQCGHFPFIEKPEKFFSLLHNFLSDTD